MRMKVFTAASLADAIAAARAEMGSEAVILSSVRTEHGVELRAAVDPARARPRFAEPRPEGGRLFQAPPGAMRPQRTGAGWEPVAAQNPPPIAEPNGALRNDIRAALRHLLVQEGADELFAQGVAAAGAKLGGASPSAALAAALGALIDFAPLAPALTRSIVLVGESGAGRSACAGKLGLLAELADSDAELISFDPDKLGGRERVAALSRRPVEAIFDPKSPAEMLAEIAALRLADTPFILDAPGADLRQTDPFARAREWAEAGDAELIGVMSAQGHPSEIAEAAERFKEAGIRRLILTRLDLSRRKATALGAISRSRLSLAQLGLGLVAPGGMVPASAHRLVRLLAGETEEVAGMRGALG